MNPSVSLCIFTHNDLPMLKATLLHEIKWVDQICILDMASTDGTKEFCEAWLRPGIDVYLRRETNTCPESGFGEAKNANMAMASCDWVLCSGADTVMDWKQAHTIKPVLADCKGDILSILTVNVPFYKFAAHQIEQAALLGGVIERHRVFIRRGSGIDYKGYIHEEPFRGEENAWQEEFKTDLRRYHFQGCCNDRLRLIRYAWMFRRALRNPKLQKYTNRHWYDVWCKEHASEIDAWADEYEKVKL